MKKTQIWTVVGCCGLALAVLAWGQSKPKAGLWETTSQMTMAGMPQMPQMPPGVQMPASPFAPHTSEVCVTQAMIDKYGSPLSNPPRGNCQVTDVQMRPDGMSAKIVCTGQMNATGTVQTTFVDSSTTKTTVHFAGTMQMGQNSRPVDMTIQSTSTYKGPDCGSVQPPVMPAGK